MTLRRIAQEAPLLAALVFEGAMIPLALALALILGVRPWTAVHAPPLVLLEALVATVPLLALLALASRLRTPWLRELEDALRDVVHMLFRRHGHGTLLFVAAFVGVAEELLFRGVLQAWLVGLAGPGYGVVFAGLIFGLAHAATRAYFVLASLMGLYLGVLYQVTGNLLLPILVHALYDWIAIEYLLWRGPRSSDRNAVVPER